MQNAISAVCPVHQGQRMTSGTILATNILPKEDKGQLRLIPNSQKLIFSSSKELSEDAVHKLPLQIGCIL
ncbi:hypothetical protein CHUAL_008376 [Chamberlinius hualienensis]